MVLECCWSNLFNPNIPGKVNLVINVFGLVEKQSCKFMRYLMTTPRRSLLAGHMLSPPTSNQIWAEYHILNGVAELGGEGVWWVFWPSQGSVCGVISELVPTPRLDVE